MKILIPIFMSAAVANVSNDEILSISKKIISGENCSSCQSSFVDADTKSKNSNPSSNLYVFVSSSLSNQSLRELFNDASKIGAKLIFNGLINNSFKDTYQYFKDIEINADIDPEKFEKYQVSAVPTFVLASENDKQFDRVQGNVSLEEVLTQFKDRGDLKSPAGRLLKKLREDRK